MIRLTTDILQAAIAVSRRAPREERERIEKDVQMLLLLYSAAYNAGRLAEFHAALAHFTHDSILTAAEHIRASRADASREAQAEQASDLQRCPACGGWKFPGTACITCPPSARA